MATRWLATPRAARAPAQRAWRADRGGREHARHVAFDRALAPATALLTLLAASCARSPSPFRPAGRGAAQLASLGIATTIITSVVTAAVFVIMAVAIWRRRALPPGGPMAPPPPGPADNRRAFRWIIGGTLGTAALLVGLGIASLAVLSASATPASARKGLIVRVIGHQWWWQVQYLSPDSMILAEGANEIHLPTGVPVRLQLVGADVIHSFWVPELQGKTDMIPGRPNKGWIEADRPGVYRGQCAEYCGLQHAHMDFEVVAEPAAQFQGFLSREAMNQAVRDTSRGERVFVGSSCGLCHTIRGTGALGAVGPDLTHFGSRRTIGAALLPNNVGNLAAWIVDAQHFKPGIIMPAIGNPKGGSLMELAQYLESLK